MKKVLIVFFMTLSFPSFAQLGAILGAVGGGGAGAALIGAGANIATGLIQEKKRKEYISEIKCVYNGQKVSDWDGAFKIPVLNLEAARQEYYSRKGTSDAPTPIHGMGLIP